MNKSIRICVFGIVQGVGFRPFISRLGHRFSLVGTVCNKGSYVEIMAQGDAQDIDAFCKALRDEAPPRSTILKIQIQPAPEQAVTDFKIVESVKTDGDVFVSPDIAICDTCTEELFDPSNRRYLHPFINCTACGPRLTILDSMPYDRERTSMGEFPMCPSCHDEYIDPASRRYDAQPVCCNDCGPHVYTLDHSARDGAAITAARRIIAAGGLIAIKGIGGFHFCGDATNEAVVQRLRAFKNRPVKPFAVMMRDMTIIRQHCVVTDEEEAVLKGYQKPIVLVSKKKSSHLAPSVAPGNPSVGVMLPYTPLHLLLFSYPDGLEVPSALLMTSANEQGAPLCHSDEEIEKIADGCDLVLTHNRRIRLRADDSVMAFYDGEPYMIRRSRGYAPLPVMMEGFTGKVLGIGGELKNTFCLAKDSLYYLSPYIGDMADIRTQEALKSALIRMERLLSITPSVVVCDGHPRYETSVLAKNLGIPVVTVQHHYGHILSCMAENGVTHPVIGVAFDGTGYGDDGTIWGGEILISHLHGYERFSSVTPFWQYGGDASSRDGWRIASSLIYERTTRSEDVVKALGLCDKREFKAQQFLYRNHMNGVVSTSAGRLFDGVSAILGVCTSSTFEGEGAMKLQFAAMQGRSFFTDSYKGPLLLEDGHLATTDLVQYIWEQRLAGADVCALAFLFHKTLADMVAASCMSCRQRTGLSTVALSGGVYQNLLLLELTEKALTKAGFTVIRHHLIPPNDGGLALGQALYGMANA